MIRGAISVVIRASMKVSIRASMVSRRSIEELFIIRLAVGVSLKFRNYRGAYLGSQQENTAECERRDATGHGGRQLR